MNLCSYINSSDTLTVPFLLKGNWIEVCQWSIVTCYWNKEARLLKMNEFFLACVLGWCVEWVMLLMTLLTMIVLFKRTKFLIILSRWNTCSFKHVHCCSMISWMILIQGEIRFVGTDGLRSFKWHLTFSSLCIHFYHMSPEFVYSIKLQSIFIFFLFIGWSSWHKRRYSTEMSHHTFYKKVL